MARSEALGITHEVILSQGRIRYRERGGGPPVVFVRGLLVNADLWRAVVPAVAGSGSRCIAPDWPFGSHEVAVPRVGLSPPGAATLIASFLDRLDLRDVTPGAGLGAGIDADLGPALRVRALQRLPS